MVGQQKIKVTHHHFDPTLYLVTFGADGIVSSAPV